MFVQRAAAGRVRVAGAAIGSLFRKCSTNTPPQVLLYKHRMDPKYFKWVARFGIAQAGFVILAVPIIETSKKGTKGQRELTVLAIGTCTLGALFILRKILNSTSLAIHWLPATNQARFDTVNVLGRTIHTDVHIDQLKPPIVQGTLTFIESNGGGRWTVGPEGVIVNQKAFNNIMEALVTRKFDSLSVV